MTSLAAGASLRREVTVIANAVIAGDILKLRAKLSHDTGLERDNTAEFAISVIASPSRLSAAITATPDSVTDLLFYSLTVSNVSPLPINDVSVLLRVPAELSFDRTTGAEPNAAGCSFDCLPTQEAVFNLGTLAAGESRGIVINATLATGLANGILIATAVRVTATGLVHDINLLNTTTVFNAPSAELSLSASADPVTVNEIFTYHLDVGNVSAGALTTLQLRANLPPGVTISAFSAGGTQVGSDVVVWDVASLAAGAALQREVTVIADAAAAGDILKLSAELTHDSGLELDNTAEFALTVAATPSRLSVVIAAAPDPVLSGGILFYTITVTNAFLLPVDAVSVLFSVPSELSFERTAGAEPNAAGCSFDCSPGQQATFNLGTIAPGANQVITINATVAAGLNAGTLITAPVRVTATDLPDIINLQHITVIQ